MEMTLEIAGFNLERLLTMAADAGIVIRKIQRIDTQHMRVRLSFRYRKAFVLLCTRYGWDVQIVAKGMLLKGAAWFWKRPMILAGALLYAVLMMISSEMIWQIQIENAGKSTGEIRRYLQETHVGSGRFKRAVSINRLREELMLRLPDLAQITVEYEGSRLLISGQPALEGERTAIDGTENDLIASKDGLITGIVVKRGTPVVSIGQAVRAGDVLIRGEERGEKQSTHPVAAEGTVTARVWARGDACVSRYTTRTVETGAVRRKITMISPWHGRVVTDAVPFERQDESIEIQRIVGLYFPLVREIRTLAEIEIIREERKLSDTVSMAQGAAEQLAKNKCPVGVHILDKTVENSMIDNEYVYAAVVLAYEDSIAVRRDHETMIGK